MSLGNSVAIASGSVLTVKMNEILMPPSLSPMDGIYVFSGDDEFYKIEYAEYATISNTLPGDEDTTDYTSSMSITTLTGVLEEDQTYEFSVYTTGDIPMNGYFTLYVPTSVGMPTNDVDDMTLTCE